MDKAHRKRQHEKVLLYTLARASGTDMGTDSILIHASVHLFFPQDVNSGAVP